MASKRIVLIITALILITSQVTGCAKIKANNSKQVQETGQPSNRTNTQEQEEVRVNEDNVVTKREEQSKIATDGLTQLGTTEDGKAYGDGWIEVGQNEMIVSGDEKLPSGLTMDEAAKMIQKDKDIMTRGNYAQADIQAELEADAKGLGTTLEQVNKYLASQPAKTPTVAQNQSSGTTQQSGSQSSGATQQSGGNYTRQEGVAGTFPVQAGDKNGDGINDALVRPDGSSVVSNTSGVGSYDPGVQITGDWNN